MNATLTNPYHLTEEQKKFYHQNGYLLGLPPIYTKAEMAKLNAELPNLLALLNPGETTKDIREWHETSTYLYEIAMNPKILDLVEGILGGNFYFWASNFFIKEPHDKSTVGWFASGWHHQAQALDRDVFRALARACRRIRLQGRLRRAISAQGGGVLLARRPRDPRFSGEPVRPPPRWPYHSLLRHEREERLVGESQLQGLGVDEFKLNPYGPIPTQRYGRPNFKPVSNEEAGKA